MGKIIGAHDTLTGYPTKGFVSWLFKPMTKCQTKNLEELAKAGVTCYDIRIWFGKDNKWHYGHGISEYDIICNPTALMQYLQVLHNAYNPYRVLFVRMLLERPINEGRSKFINLCKDFEKSFPDITFLPARDKHTWEILYSFGHTDDIVHEYHASVSGKDWRKYFPYLFHKKYGKDYELQEGINLIDFI